MPDNFVQQPENTQNYNRYAYVLNNPLRYTDPSGEFIPFLVAVAIGAFIGGATYAATCFFGGQDFSWSGLATSTFIGAMSAAVTFGIGQVAGSMFTQVANQSMQQIARGAMQALMHGTFQGAMASIQGGDFWSAAAAGALSSIASSAFGFDGNGKNADGLGWGSSVRSSSAGMIAFGTLAGGAGASLTGGNFWQGAVTGLVVSGLNHAMHSGDGADDNGYDKNGNKINDNGGDKTDTMYNDDGSVFSTTAVENITADGGFHDSLRGYGYKLNFKMATGAITEDNTIANLFTGGAAAKGVGSLLSSKSASLVLKYSSTLNKGNWWRLGQGFNPSTGLKNIRLAWGAHPNYLQQVPKFLQGINTSLRNFAQGHIHFPNWKP